MEQQGRILYETSVEVPNAQKGASIQRDLRGLCSLKPAKVVVYSLLHSN